VFPTFHPEIRRVLRSRLAAVVLVLGLGLPVPTAFAAPSGFAFLEVPAGARATALGGAYVSLADGVDGAFWNPAGLAGVRGTQVSGSHAEFVQGLKHDQFAVAGRLLGGGLAGSMRAMYSQPIEARDELGNLTGSFGSHDLEFQLGYGWQPAPSARFGFSAQAVRERIDNESATTWSAGAGATWQPQAWKRARFGLSAQHLGPAAHYDLGGQQGAPVELPASVQAGGAWTQPLGHGLDLTAALEARATRGRQAVAGVGAELASGVGAVLRAGFREGDDLTNYSAGVGYRLGTFTVDYAFVPARLDLGDTHRFSFAAQF
jgi:hypothetical protein